MNLKQALNKPTGTRILVPMNQPSLAFERAYRADLRRLLQGAAGGIRDIIIPSFQRSPMRDGFTADADSAAFGSFTNLLAALSRIVTDRVKELIGLETKRHTEQWLKNAKKAFSIDLKGVISEENLGAYIEAAGLRNASLIKGLTDDLVKRVQQDTLNALVSGQSVATLKESLKHSLNVSDSRAELIAYDQTSKLNADLNKQRHKEAGIDTYIWRTAQDERVRARHRALEGVQYKYDEPTGAEDGLPPGQPIRCRCNAQAVVDFSKPEAVKPKQKMVAEEVAPQTVPSGKKPMSPAQTAALAKAQEASKAKGEATKKAAAEAKAAAKVAKEKAKQEAAAAVAAAKVAAKAAAAKAAHIAAEKVYYEQLQAKMAAEAAKAKTAEIATATKAAKAKAAAILKTQKAAAKSTLAPFNPTSRDYQSIGQDFPKVAAGESATALSNYVGSGYRGMNAYYRTGGKEGAYYKEQAQALKNAINKSVIPADIRAYRGVGQITDMVPGATDVTKLLGATIEDAGFLSVATNPKVSVNFARGNNRNPPPPPLMIEFRLRKGQKGIHVGRHGLRYDETEIILAPGTKLRVVEAKQADGKVGSMFDYVSVEVVDD